MAVYLGTTLAAFTTNIQRSKNRLIAIPAEAQSALGLGRRRENHIVAYSIRRAGRGRWNHHLATLTYDNEFSVPSDVVGLRAGDRVDVKIHRVIADVAVAAAPVASPADPLLALGASAGRDERTDGSERVDEYLASDV